MPCGYSIIRLEFGLFGLRNDLYMCVHRLGRHIGFTNKKRLKMREWKMRYAQKCKGGECRSRQAVWQAEPIL